MSRSILRVIRAIDLTVSCACISALVVLTVYGVMMRYVANAPLIWLEEVQMMLIVWVVMFAGSAAFRELGHVSIDVAVGLLPPAGQRFLQLLVAAVVLSVLALLVWLGASFVEFQLSADRVTDVLRIPYGLVYLAVPVGGTLMLLSYIFGELAPTTRTNGTAREN